MLALLASASRGDIETLFLIVAVLFALGALYLLVALQNIVGAVAAIVCAILVVVFLA